MIPQGRTGHDQEPGDPVVDEAFQLLVQHAWAPPDFHAQVLARVAHQPARRGLGAWLQRLQWALPVPALAVGLLLSLTGNVWLWRSYHAVQTTEESAGGETTRAVTRGSPAEAMPYVEHGEHAAAAGDYADALQAYERALALFEAAGNRGWQAKVLGDIGAAQAALQQFADALAAYEQALQISHELGDEAGADTIRTKIGAVYQDLGRDLQALQAYEAALRARGAPFAPAFREVAALYYTAGHYPQAIQAATTALALTPEDALAYRYRGLALKAVGDQAQAERDMQRAASLGDEEARTTLRVWGSPQ